MRMELHPFNNKSRRIKKRYLIQVSMEFEGKSLEYLWEDEDDDSSEYNEPYRSSPESYKLRQRRRESVQPTDDESYQTRGLSMSLLSTSNDMENHTDGSSTTINRKGYNTTLLSLCQYDYKLYKLESDKLSWEIRLDLLKDFQNVHGHLFVPYRYTVKVHDYTINGTLAKPYPIHLGRWMYQIRKLYRDKPDTLSSKHVQELKSLGVELLGVGMGRRPASFIKHLNMLQEFQKKYGHCRVPRIYSDNPSLGLWSERQRSLFRRKCLGMKSSLTQERIQQLLDVGFDFGVQLDGVLTLDSIYNQTLQPISPNVINAHPYIDIRNYFETCWKHMFERLIVYKQYHGTCNVPFNYIHDPALGLWAHEQCREYSLLIKTPSAERKTGLSSLMTVSRFRLLTELGFDFLLEEKILPCPWRDIAKQDFDPDLIVSSLSNIIYEQTSKCIDIQTKEAAIFYLFFRRLKWEERYMSDPLSVQRMVRKLYTQNETIMEVMKRFNVSSVFHDNDGVKHLLDKEFDWWDNFFDMIRYKRQHGDFDIQRGVSWYLDKLSDWLTLQIQNYNSVVHGHYDDENPAISERHFQALVDVGFSFHHSESLTDIEPLTPGRKLSLFQLEQISDREILKIRRMQHGRLGKIHDLARDHAWAKNYEALRYHLLVTDEHVSSLPGPLSYWIRNQIDQYYRYKSGLTSTLTPKRIRLLEDIGFLVNAEDTDHYEWSSMIEALKVFKRTYGHCFVPPSWKEKKLGKWLHKVKYTFQRSSTPEPTNASSLSADQIRELVAIGVDLHVDDYTWAVLSYNTLFHTRILELRNFKKTFGHCNITLDYKDRYFELSLWAREQRMLYKMHNAGRISTLDSEKIQALNELQFNWE